MNAAQKKMQKDAMMSSSKKNMAASDKKKTAQLNSKKQSSADKRKVTDVKAGASGKKSPVSKVTQLLKDVAKIDTLPKNVRESVPIRGVMTDGVIETKAGDFTKSYKIQDVNFSIAPDEDQKHIYMAYMDFLNSFNEGIRWQFNIWNHEIDKRETIESVRIAPQKDGLNKHRQEMNKILLDNLKKGNNSITQDKYLTISIHDDDAEHAKNTLRRLDAEVSKKLRKICKQDTKPMTTLERLKLLYNIYNQQTDYRFATSVLDGKDEMSLKQIEKQGLSIKDIIGPSSIDYRKESSFMLGDTYAQALFLKQVPSYLTTDFIADLADIQSSMLISITSESVNSDKAVKMVRGLLSTIEGKVSDVQKRNGENGVYAPLPPDLERQQENARELMKDIQGRNQNIFYVTLLCVVFARTQEQLEENVKLVRSTAAKHIAPMEPLKFQQEFAFNTALPLARNELTTSRLCTTESAAVFIPYNAQELSQKNAVFYGLNQSTKSMVLYDRTTGPNYNSLIFGSSGSGKSFTAKVEMISVLLNKSNSQVFVLDPQGEYSPLVKAFGGEEIILSPGGRVFVNPLDLDISEDEDGEIDPVAMKVDFVVSMFDIIIGKERELSAIHTSILDKCTRKIYRSYIENLVDRGITCDISRCPTLTDLYQELQDLRIERPEAGSLADVLYQYAVGSFGTFAHRTNVRTNARFVCYNTKLLGSGMKELGLHICINDVWNRMIHNAKAKIYTYMYIDEFHILLESPSTTLFLKRIYKMARKWNGCPTGIMQNTEDLLRDADSRAIVNNTSFIIMLREPLMDRNNLAELLSLSPAQLEYITDSDPGAGLIYNGKITIPFALDFPKDSELYKLISTSNDVRTEKKKKKFAA